jgi:hypothetical protein
MLRNAAVLLSLALLFPGAANSEFRFQPSSITVGAGPAKLDGAGTTFFLSGRVDLATFTSDLVWDAGFHWWKKTDTATFAGFDGFGLPITSEIDTSYRDFAILSGVKYLFHVENEKILPYARGGLSLNFVDVSVETSGMTTGAVSGGQTDLGLYLGGGASYRYSPSVLFGLEAAFNMTEADHFLFGFTVSFPLNRGGP